MGITYDQAMKLRVGDIIHTTADGWPACDDAKSNRWKVNGKVKVWKTRPGHFRIPVKFGLRSYDYIDQDTENVHLESECPA